MSESAGDVELRLAEIDRRLREIQEDLVPGRTPRETRMPSEVDVPPRTSERDADSRGRSGPLAEALQRARNARPEREQREQHERGHRTPGDYEQREQTHRPPPDPASPPPSHDRPPARTRLQSRQPNPQSSVLSELQSSLLAATRDLLDGYERAVSSAAASPPVQVTLSAGPFSATDALRAFEDALSRIPGVREVEVRGYEGEHGAILDVALEQEQGAEAAGGSST